MPTIQQKNSSVTIGNDVTQIPNNVFSIDQIRADWQKKHIINVLPTKFITTLHAANGDHVDFKLISNITVGDRNIFLENQIVIGTVIDITRASRTKNAEITIEFPIIKLYDGTSMKIKGIRYTKKQEKKGAQIILKPSESISLNFDGNNQKNVTNKLMHIKEI